jgi:two-component system nitrogen regulation sensor histidine kinase GlnL
MPDLASDRTVMFSDSAVWLNSLSTCVAVLDPMLSFVYANPAFVDATQRASWRGCPLSILGAAEPSILALIERVRENDESVVSRDEAWVEGRRADIAVSGIADGSFLLEVHTRATSNDSAPRLSASLRGLAHEMKNPLAGLRGAAQLLKRRIDDPDQRQLADLVISEADRLSALADRLLHPHGQAPLRSVNLHKIAERARALIGAEADAQLRLERDYDPSLPNVRADADAILQVLLNLLRNAMQASAKAITVRTRVERAAMISGESGRLALRIDVIDDGSGVPDELRESLFMPLVSGRVDGTGLGLALAQEIATAHGGQLTFQSRPGNTTFSLILPSERDGG